MNKPCFFLKSNNYRLSRLRYVHNYSFLQNKSSSSCSIQQIICDSRITTKQPSPFNLVFHRHYNQQPHSNRYNDRSIRYLSQTSLKKKEDNNEVGTSGTIPENKNQRLKVAVVGAGPSGFYTAKYLISSLSKQRSSNLATVSGIDIDMIDRLPTPYGLVRTGVAPDHPEVKNVQNDFDKLFLPSTSASNEDDDETFSNTMEFRGNVTIGKDVTLSELQSLYHVVVLAYGCESDRKLGLDGEESLLGVLSAREFVAWYNGHPDFVHIGDIVEQVLQSNGSNVNGSASSNAEAEVVVIGQGNVALDCARILAKGEKGLVHTDIANHALKVLGDGVKKTTVLGRRGHVQGAFTIKELRELVNMEKDGHDTSFIVQVKELDAGTTDATLEELSSPRSRPKVRIDKLLRDAAAAVPSKSANKEVALRFLLNPIKFIPNPSNPSRIGSILCQRTELQGEPWKQVAKGKEGELEEIPASLVLVSIGYKGIPLPGMEEKNIFDGKRGTVKNVHGKVEDGLYVSGWLKRGPSGIIGTNIADAKDTVLSIVSDLENGRSSSLLGLTSRPGRSSLDDIVRQRGGTFVDWAGYQAIDAVEKDPSRSRCASQPREKLTEIEDMIRVATHPY